MTGTGMLVNRDKAFIVTTILLAGSGFLETEEEIVLWLR